ncbi:MAG: response regulator [Lachnospiraceae bacterium]|nr:response regulator [Lachnospiraceae bacterium]
MAKVLLVDDSKTSRKILRTILEGAGHTIVDEASNGEEGVEKYLDLKPDVTTLDITMPVMDGIEALKQIKLLDKDAKVIMVTAASQKSKMLEAVKYGAADFIAKPFEPEQIVNIVNKLVG